jgi:hypothetical protein
MARAGSAGLLLLSAHARADGALGAAGSPITTSQYNVDLFQGPVLATTRIMSMGGAYTAIGEGADAIPFNPAAVSHRAPYSTTRVDYDVTGGVTLPTSVTNTDFDNNGDTNFQTKNFVWGAAGGQIQYDHLGIGAFVSGQNYVLDQPQIIRIPDIPEAADKVIIRVLKIDAVASYGLADDQLHVGGGLRTAHLRAIGSARDASATATTSADLTGDTRERQLFATDAYGVQGGILWVPRALPLRLGGAVRSPLVGAINESEGRFKIDPTTKDIRAGDFYFPEKVDLPWEVEAAAAVQFWKRPLNLGWTNEDNVPEAESERYRKNVNDDVREPAWRGARRLLKERYKAIPRERVLVSTSVLVSGPVANAVGFESMLARRVQRSGEDISLTVRGGVEAEVIPLWLVVRGGSYLEPTRFRTSSSRLHGTAGFQVKLFTWNAFGLTDDDTIWRLSLGADIARDYFAWSVGAGFFR